MIWNGVLIRIGILQTTNYQGAEMDMLSVVDNLADTKDRLRLK